MFRKFKAILKLAADFAGEKPAFQIKVLKIKRIEFLPGSEKQPVSDVDSNGYLKFNQYSYENYCCRCR
jgi:hypothetical protein